MNSGGSARRETSSTVRKLSSAAKSQLRSGRPAPAASVTLRNHAETISSKIGVVSALSKAACRARRCASDVPDGAASVPPLTAAFHHSLTVVLLARNSSRPDRSPAGSAGAPPPGDTTSAPGAGADGSGASSSEGHSGTAPVTSVVSVPVTSPPPGTGPPDRRPGYGVGRTGAGVDDRPGPAPSEPIGVNNAVPESSLSVGSGAACHPSAGDAGDAGDGPAAVCRCPPGFLRGSGVPSPAAGSVPAAGVPGSP